MTTIEAVIETPTRNRDRALWWTVLAAGLVGTGLTSTQIVEKITILKDPAATLSCDVNSVLSCSDVLNAWQSSVLGPPNALIGAIMFTILWSAAAGPILGSTLGRWHLAILWGLAVFFLCFATWYMEQTAFSIGRLCLWCIGNTTMVILLCACITRIAAHQDAFGHGAFGRVMTTATHSGVDLIVWIGWWVAIAAMLVVGLAL